MAGGAVGLGASCVPLLSFGPRKEARGVLAMSEEMLPVSLIDVLDALGVDMPLTEGDLVTDVVVIARVSNVDSPSATLALAHNLGQDWITRMGMLEYALWMERDGARGAVLDD